MPATYDKIATYTVPSSTSSYTFSSIPGTYTDLVLIANYGSSTTEDYLLARFNSDSATNYSGTSMHGNGSTATSGRNSTRNVLFIDWGVSCENAINTNSIISIMNYANSTTFKSVLIRNNRATATNPTYTGTEAQASIWRKTPEAITSITLSMLTANILTGSTFTLYGIKAA